MSVFSKERVITALRLWVPLAVVTTGLVGLVYMAVQQDLRMGANDVPAQIAQDDEVWAGNPRKEVAAGAAVDASPWAGAVNAALSGIYRLGINAGVLIIALVLLVLGVVILLRAPLAKASPLGKVAKAVKA